MDKQTGYRTRSVVCVPVVDDNGNVFAVLQAINKVIRCLCGEFQPLTPCACASVCEQKDQFSSVLSTSSDSKDTQDSPADAVGTADDATGAQTGADKSVPASRIVVSAAPEDASNSNGSPRVGANSHTDGRARVVHASYVAVKASVHAVGLSRLFRG